MTGRAKLLACLGERQRMKAIVTIQYGPPNVLQLQEIATPAPAEDEVLIKVYAASVNPLDTFTIRGPLFFIPALGRLLKPKHQVAGADIAGRVESVGRDVKQFRPGDEVFGCSFGKNGMGGFAEYVCTVEDSLALKPSNLSFEEAAAVPVAALTALQGLRDKGQIQPGHKVLIDGASGGVGTFAVQIAKFFGAEVTAVCSSSKIDTARSIGADRIIDYAQEDFTKNGQQYDLILGANAHHSIFDYRRSLTRHGIFVMVGGALVRIIQAAMLTPFLSRIGSRKMRFFIAKTNTKDLTYLKDLLEAGKIVSVIDRCYPLSQVAEALRYLEQKHARGKIVITVEHSEDVRSQPLTSAT
jgi:NADPH:quinone reductase-like Zn-dependent oxidoreductase